MNNKANVWVWIIVAIVVIAIIGIVIYFLMSGDSGSVIGGGSSFGNIPQPPALPD